MVYEQAGEFGKAMDIYSRALRRMPDLWIAANNLAYLLCEHTGKPADLDRALDLARKARQLAPDEPTVADTLGWVLYRKADLKQAYAEIRAASAKDPANPLYNYHVGMVLKRQGKPSEAKERLSASLKENGRFPGRDEAEQALQALEK
jgi:tetratricopeptide (TPR) repeat protein